MGSYATFYIDRYDLTSTKNSIDEYLIRNLFRKDDLRIFTRQREERIQKEYKGDKSKEKAYLLQSTIQVIIDRLEIQGYTLKKAEKEFQKNKKFLINEENASIRYYKKILREDDFAQSMIKKSLSAIEFFSHYSYQSFLKDITEITKKEIRPYFSDVVTDEIKTFLDYYYDHSENDLIYSIEGFHPLFFLRSLLENFNKRKFVTYELTDIIHGNYVTVKEIDFQDAEKIIILTEGSTDIFIIKETIELLHPHLKDYYHFLDFHTTNNPGGTANLVTIVKSFIGAGIKNNIIALFDNDASGSEALQLLNTIKRPKNFKVLKYPNIEIAKKYPTIGPTGKKRMNINGTACSIELYLGKNVLSSTNLPPVIWKTVNSKTGTYQGEIQDKKYLFEKFKALVKECKADHEKILKVDWSNLKLILNAIFECFK